MKLESIEVRGDVEERTIERDSQRHMTRRQECEILRLAALAQPNH